MKRSAVVAALVLLAPVASAATVDVNAVLDAQGAGDVVFVIDISPQQTETLSAAPGPELRRTLLFGLLVSPSRELWTLLKTHGFNVRSIDRSTRDGTQKTIIKAGINSVLALALGGGRLDLARREGGFLHLQGDFGGAMAGHRDQLPSMADVDVKLTLVFDGAVLSVDKPWEPEHSGEAVTYRDTADRLLTYRLPVHARIRPNVEATTTFWMLLIFGVVILVVLGSYIILQRGRDAMGTGSSG